MTPMTPNAALGQSQGTGDLNLTGALMALGIPLDPLCECTEIHRDQGRGSYGRFYLLPQSADGKHDTHQLSRVWSGFETLPKNHPFSWIVEFIEYGRRLACSTTDDWLAAGHDHCRDLGLDPKVVKVAMKPDHEVQDLGDSRQAYIFAFVSCREIARKVFAGVRRRNQVMMSRDHGGGIVSHAIIDASLPKPQRNELLSRLEGA